MIKKLVPLLAAVAIVTLALGPGRQFLPAPLRLQSGGTLTASDDMSDIDHGKATGIGIAPDPVTNPRATAARLTVAVQPLEKAERGYSLSTTVLGPDGKPIADARVKFYALVDLFGQREMLIAATTTDGRGVASYAYLPAQLGPQAIVVRYAGQGKVTAGEGRMTFDATVAAPELAQERKPLISFTDRVPYAAGLIVLAVWALIAFALLGTARGVIAGARSTRGKEELI